MVGLLHGGALVLYSIAGLALVGALASGRRRASWFPLATVSAATVLHGIGLVAFVLTFRELPLAWLAPSFSTLAFLIGGYLLAITAVHEGPPLGLVLVPIVVVLLVSALVLGISPAGDPLSFRGVWGSLHVLLSFTGCAGLAVAFASGLLYLLQFRELKEKRFGRVFRFFPSLQTLDRLGRHALGVGFAALTLGLLLGWAGTVQVQEPLEGMRSEVAWGVFTWAMFVVALTARARGGGARNRRGAIASVIGFVLVVLAYVVLRVFVAQGPSFL